MRVRRKAAWRATIDPDHLVRPSYRRTVLTRSLVYSLILVAALAACQAPPPPPQGDAEALALLDRARDHHGSALLDGATVRFSFRGTPFTATRDGGTFRYARTYADDLGRTVEEVVDNAGTHRFVDGAEVILDAAEAGSVHTAVNSVVYFALLPLPLADGAVRARMLPPDSVGGQPFERVEVTFARDGGGSDFDDRYVYWLRPSDAEISHFAYTYAPSPGDTSRTETGTRFRIPIGASRVDGVLFQNWQNLTADSLADIADFGQAFDAGRTFDVSTVVLEDIQIAR